MVDFFQQFNPVTQAFIATLFTWGVTAAGAALVFFTRALNQKVMDSMLGFAAGVMIAASFWSLLAPGIEMAEQLGHIPWLTAAIGFMGAFEAGLIGDVLYWNKLPIKLYKDIEIISTPGHTRRCISVIVKTKITASPKPNAVSTRFDTAKNEHIPRKYAKRIFSTKIALTAKLI